MMMKGVVVGEQNGASESGVAAAAEAISRTKFEPSLCCPVMRRRCQFHARPSSQERLAISSQGKITQSFYARKQLAFLNGNVTPQLSHHHQPSWARVLAIMDGGDTPLE